MTETEPLARPIGWWLKEADARLDSAFDHALAARQVDRRGWQLLASLARRPMSRTELVAALIRFDTAAVIDAVLGDLVSSGWIANESGMLSLTAAGVRAQVELASWWTASASRSPPPFRRRTTSP